MYGKSVGSGKRKEREESWQEVVSWVLGEGGEGEWWMREVEEERGKGKEEYRKGNKGKKRGRGASEKGERREGVGGTIKKGERKEKQEEAEVPNSGVCMSGERGCGRSQADGEAHIHS